MSFLAMGETVLVKSPPPSLWVALPWPKCRKPEEGEGIGGFSAGGIHYKKKEVSPGNWEWTVDEEAMVLSKTEKQSLSRCAERFRDAQ